MTGIAGILNLQDTDNLYVNTIGQSTVYEAARMYVDQINTDTNKAFEVFVEGDIEDYKERYKLPSGGRLDKRGGQSQSSAAKASGSWDVAYPLEDFGKQISGDDVALAYMTLDEFQRHLDGVQIANVNTVRYEMLRAIFQNVSRTFSDPLKGDLTIQCLANGDGTLYPPVLGTESEADDTHHYGTNYLSSAISDTNNPFATIRDELEEHFGAGTGGEEVCAFINNAQTAKSRALSDFVEVVDRDVRVGDSVSVPINLPMVPGRIIGRCSGVWVVEWRWIPADYTVGLHLEASAPLKRRVDPAATGLPRGLNIVARETNFPLESIHYRNRFGMGVGNRLNGTVLKFVASTSYTIPTAYA